jgi:hypothetical protein
MSGEARVRQNSVIKGWSFGKVLGLPLLSTWIFREIPIDGTIVITKNTSWMQSMQIPYLERIIKNVAETIAKTNFSMRVVLEELQIFGAMLKSIHNTVLEIVFGQVNVHFQVSKSNLRLNHPEFGQVTRGV